MPGYPILDRDKQNLEDKFICEYCQSVLRDATRAGCGHFFCSSCVKHLFLKNPQGVCSRTGIPLFHYEFSPDVSVCNEVLNLAVHCLFLDSGCQWNGKLHDFEGHVGNCSFGSCQGKELGQAEGYEKCNQLEMRHYSVLFVNLPVKFDHKFKSFTSEWPTDEEVKHKGELNICSQEPRASGGEDLRIIPCVYPECGVVVKTTNDLTEHLKNECLYRLEICRLCNEQVNLNAMKLHRSEECRASPAKLGNCGKGGIPLVKKEQFNTQFLQRQVPFLLSSSKASKIKNSRENSLEFRGQIAPIPKEVASGNSDTRNTSSRNAVTDQHEQRLNDLENRVAQHDLLIGENSLLWQNICHLSDAFRDVSNKVDHVQHTLDCQKRDFDAFQENLSALQNEHITLQARFNRLLESPLQHGELARLNRSMEVIQERIARLEGYSRSHGGMLANVANTLTALADAVRPVQILGVDIQRI